MNAGSWPRTRAVPAIPTVAHQERGAQVHAQRRVCRPSVMFPRSSCDPRHHPITNGPDPFAATCHASCVVSPSDPFLYLIS